LILPVKVEGPALATTRVKVVVAPNPTVAVPTVLDGTILTLGKTLSTAVAVNEFVPTEVTREPDAMVLVIVPATELVTTVVMVHTPPLTEPGGMVNPVPSVKLLPPTTTVAAPPVQLVCATEVVFTRPVG
jgi:hypothetical protein